MDVASLGGFVHQYTPHNSLALYAAAVASSLIALTLVYGRCTWTRATDHLSEKWIFQTVAAAAPIPTYLMLLVVPFDPDLAASVLDDRVVVAFAGLYGLVETLKDIRDTAADAHKRKSGHSTKQR